MFRHIWKIFKKLSGSIVKVRYFRPIIRTYLKKRILVQNQGGREYQTGGASEANALRGKYSSISRT